MLPPSFYQSTIGKAPFLDLDMDNVHHAIAVLRLGPGDPMVLTDGLGQRIHAIIREADKRHCRIEVQQRESLPENARSNFSLAVALTKNRNRNEWLLEKVTELGVHHIYPLITEHSERAKFNPDRSEKILVSALIQSEQCFLPQLHPLQRLEDFLSETEELSEHQCFIAHCEDQEKKAMLPQLEVGQRQLVLIGPEGDFSLKEINRCLNSGFIPVSLGINRLRTETACLYAATVCNAFHHAS